MALNKTALATGIKALMDDLYNQNTRSTDAARTAYANGLADLIDAYVKTGTPNVPGTGLAAPSGGGTVTGTSNTGTIT